MAFNWTGKSSLSIGTGTSKTFNIIFYCDGTEYTTFRWDVMANLYYGDTTVYTMFGWNNAKYKNIKVTGGSDINNETFLNFLISNGTTEPIEDGYKLFLNLEVSNDLTGCTWTPYEEFTYNNVQTIKDKEYKLNFTSDDEDFTAIYFNSGVGRIQFYGDSYLNVGFLNTEGIGSWSDDYKSMTISGGEDVTNPEIIDFMKKTGTLSKRVRLTNSSIALDGIKIGDDYNLYLNIDDNKYKIEK